MLSVSFSRSHPLWYSQYLSLSCCSLFPLHQSWLPWTRLFWRKNEVEVHHVVINEVFFFKKNWTIFHFGLLKWVTYSTISFSLGQVSKILSHILCHILQNLVSNKDRRTWQPSSHYHMKICWF